MRLPSLDETKEFAKYIAGVASACALYLNIKKRKLRVAETNFLRRRDDAGLREVVSSLTKRIDNLEKTYNERFDKFDERFGTERDFLIGELHNSEDRITTALTNLGNRVDAHSANINTRLDNLLRK